MKPQLVKHSTSASTDIPLQVPSEEIWRKKYQLKNHSDQPVDKTVEDTYLRIASALAGVEEPSNREEWEEKFLWALHHGALPAGRIIANVGADAFKPSTSTINCTVSGTIKDSMRSILHHVTEAGLTLKAGCGIGYEFSTLRPNGGFVRGAGAQTSGPLTFMDIFDKTCFTVASAGGRRGAQMATFDIGHPDVVEFIRAKREDGRLRQFNMSVLITDEFMTAVKNDSEWKLAFPAFEHEVNDPDVEIIHRDWPNHEDYYQFDDEGRVLCKVYKTLQAKQLFNVIMTSTYDYAEPGFILIDRSNDMNNNWFCENIRSCNPCGEQNLPPHGSCLLGSTNLTKFVIDPFTDEANFDWESFRRVITVFTRMLDNVVELNGLPLDEQRKEIERKRRHGMGFLGLGSTMAMLKMSYGSKESLDFTEEVARQIAIVGFETGVELAKEKGAAPILLEKFEITREMMAKRPEMAEDGIKVGDLVEGKMLWAKYSKYFAQFPATLKKDLLKYGSRFTHHSSIAPTGTIALSLGNNASNGIEPSFAHEYSRNVIVPGKSTKEKVSVMSYELLAYRHLVDENVTVDGLPDYFVNADSITPERHVDVQAAAQKWVDSSISKTINVATDISFEDFENVYLYATEKGLKGCTTFRYNPEAFQGVLVKEEDLQNTTYQFTLADGSKVEFKGDDELEYLGDVTTAANLYDALKEGYYGKL